MATNAERQLRYRRHKVGDHSLCAADRECRAPTDNSPPPVGPNSAAPAIVRTANSVERGASGSALWSDLADAALGPGHRMLLDRACRLVDRIDVVEALVVDTTPTTHPELWTELRQLEANFARLIRQLEPSVPSKPSRSAPPAPPKGGAGIGDLTARIAARKQGAAG